MTELQTKLKNVERVFDVQKILARNSDDVKSIAKYYKKNRLAYRLFNSSEGFVHIGISENGQFSPKDFYKQAKLVQKSITFSHAKNVLELAPGKAANMRYLAEHNPKISFYGIDLENGQLNHRIKKPNMSLSYGDYHDLSNYEDNSMDIVYVIEALCHASDKKQVISEVYRVIKPGGKFIIIDGYFKKDLSELSEDQAHVCKLVFKSMMVTEKDQDYKTLSKFLKDQGFKVENVIDYSKNILPTLYKLEHKASKLIESSKLLSKPIIKITGDLVAVNAVAGYLLPICIEDDLFEYKYTLASKNISAIT